MVAATMTHASIPKEEREKSCYRFFNKIKHSIEDVEDLINDLKQAFYEVIILSIILSKQKF